MKTHHQQSKQDAAIFEAESAANRRLTPDELDELAEKYAALSSSSDVATTAAVVDTNKGDKKKKEKMKDKEKRTVEEEPIVKETIKEVEMRRVQPVIHRTREQTEIRHIIQPIVQQETAPVTTTHVIRETGIIREQVPVRRCACEDRSACSCQQQLHQHTDATSRDFSSSPSASSASCLPEGFQGPAFGASAKVTCSHPGGNMPVQIHIQPVIFAIAPGSNFMEMLNMSSDTLCHNCSGRVVYHQPQMQEVVTPHQTASHDEGAGTTEAAKESSTSAGGNRISRIFRKIGDRRKRRSLRKSQDLTGEDGSQSGSDDDSDADNADDDEEKRDDGEENKHVEFVEEKSGEKPDEAEVVRIIHTPVVI